MAIFETSQAPLLKVEKLSKSFCVARDFFGRTKKTLRAVHNVSFDIKAGECLSIVGESGCGKSTTARLIMNLIQPDSGAVIFLDENLLTLKASELREKRKNFQMVFQNPFSSLDPRYTVFDSIKEPLELHNFGSPEKIKARVYELLKLVDLPAELACKYPHECSGGQNQRVSIARAIALNPKLLVCDEALSALDVSVQANVLKLLKKLQKELDISFLFIAHDLAVVKKISDRVAVMYLGEIVELAETKELFANPKHPYTKALIASAPIADPKQRDRERFFLQGEIPKATEIPQGCPFKTRCPEKIDKCESCIPQNVELDASLPHQVMCHLYES